MPNYNCLFVSLIFIASTNTLVASNITTSNLGDNACPCITSVDYVSIESGADGFSNYDNYVLENVPNNFPKFGLGCSPHDQDIGFCDFKRDLCDKTFPKPEDCNHVDWCDRAWCYVDPSNCHLPNRDSLLFNGLAYSYASCGFMDSFVEYHRLNSLQNQVINVAFNANTGGYKGSYNPDGSFATNDKWRGPLVSFIEGTAIAAGFQMNIIAPPDHLKKNAQEYFNSTSSFDFCYYATALGYVDLCVGSFTLTEERVASGGWFHLNDENIYLTTFLEKPKTAFESFLSDAGTLLKPFSLGSWMLLIFFVIPTMGFLMLYHEYGAKDGIFPQNDKRHLLWYIFKSWYEVFNAFFAGYGGEVVTASGKAHLLGIGFFNLMVISVYTANLAAILSTTDLHREVTNIAEVRNKGFKICAERNEARLAVGVNPEIKDLLLKDPEDGEPGFECCGGRARVLDYMKGIVAPEERDLYCEVALVIEDDLTAMQGTGKHCNKTLVGKSLGVRSSGLPISERFHKPLVSIFQTHFNNGRYQFDVSIAKPESKCPAAGATVTDEYLSIQHMSGVLVGTSFFAIAALIIRLFERRNRIVKHEELCVTP